MSEQGALLGAAEIRELAASLDVVPAKRWGQNFVVDGNTVRRIVRVADVAGQRVLEIGPGLGSLTLGLTEAGCDVVAIEIDPRLAAALAATVERKQPGATLRVIADDAMRVTELPFEPEALVANLPYNVSVPVLIHMFEHFPTLQRCLVMVQAEVGHRIAAAPGSKVYGAPSVKAAWWGSWSVEAEVSRQVFWPVPNVDSVLVGFRPGEIRGDETLRRAMFDVVDAAFGQRRKMLRGALAGLFGSSEAASSAITAAGVDPTARGEALTVDEFIAIARQLR
ncbi:16S rRNA (adenine(1518)-N(6)/adenine(1519)-N(6))-dimethyltransferase RsmA [Agrococcus casei]|uniref:Ribosomal RNA small subunit methyltransferase A n=1 Tax=Agrococcus casei LMG 22410 TaxID=1255656 RepID=A0A1R4EW95_9MICO|nr:16S rRNA (adenine(1518)-N(6)/adenine(1519)-N(6))-dimethyltransferase RsmA [Agrococcus casei]SJM47947.1 SSU rRNA (adenine(1518)-N(6)/adenine(1519)-N(6))-dimethyltransferase [Agrococcus casei LMG 22410]